VGGGDRQVSVDVSRELTDVETQKWQQKHDCNKNERHYTQVIIPDVLCIKQKENSIDT